MFHVSTLWTRSHDLQSVVLTGLPIHIDIGVVGVDVHHRHSVLWSVKVFPTSVVQPEEQKVLLETNFLTWFPHLTEWQGHSNTLPTMHSSISPRTHFLLRSTMAGWQWLLRDSKFFDSAAEVRCPSLNLSTISLSNICSFTLTESLQNTSWYMSNCCNSFSLNQLKLFFLSPVSPWYTAPVKSW